MYLRLVVTEGMEQQCQVCMKNEEKPEVERTTVENIVKTQVRNNVSDI